MFRSFLSSLAAPPRGLTLHRTDTNLCFLAGLVLVSSICRQKSSSVKRLIAPPSFSLLHFEKVAVVKKVAGSILNLDLYAW